MKKIKKILLACLVSGFLATTIGGVVGYTFHASAENPKTGFYVEDGAAVRLKSEHEKFGIKFSAQVGERVEGATYNMLIAPVELLELYENDTNENKEDIVTYLKAYAESKGGKLSIVEDCEVKNGKIYFTTKGINNNTEERLPVCEDDIVGLYKGGRIGGVGHIAMFMQSTAGLIVCIFVPLAALIGFELYRAKKKDKVKENDIEALMAELQALKSQQASAENKSETDPTKESPEENKKD